MIDLKKNKKKNKIHYFFTVTSFHFCREFISSLTKHTSGTSPKLVCGRQAVDPCVSVRATYLYRCRVCARRQRRRHTSRARSVDHFRRDPWPRAAAAAVEWASPVHRRLGGGREGRRPRQRGERIVSTHTGFRVPLCRAQHVSTERLPFSFQPNEKLPVAVLFGS